MRALHKGSIIDHSCCNPCLRLVTKARLSPRVAFHAPRSAKSVRERTLTLPSELPCWELESQWTSESSKNDWRGQNSLDWSVPYIIGKLLEPRCLKWLAWLIWNLKDKLWSKEGSRVKLAVWLLTTKSCESTWFPCVQVACHIPLKRSQWELQLFLRPHINWRFAEKVMGPQSCKSPKFGNFETPTWKSWDKMPFGCGPRGEAQNIL
jgi:hypothetical protein